MRVKGLIHMLISVMVLHVVSLSLADEVKLPCKVKQAGTEILLEDITITGAGVSNAKKLPVFYGEFRFELPLVLVKKMRFKSGGETEVDMVEGTFSGRTLVEQLTLSGPFTLGTFRLGLNKVTEIVFNDPKASEFKPPKGFIAQLRDIQGVAVTLYDVKVDGNTMFPWRYGEADLSYPFGRLTKVVIPAQQPEKGKQIKVELIGVSGEASIIEITSTTEVRGLTNLGSANIPLLKVKQILFLPPIDIEPEPDDKFSKWEGWSYKTKRLPENGGERLGRFKGIITDNKGNVAEVLNLAFRSDWTSPGDVGITVDARGTVFPINMNGVVRQIWFSKIDRVYLKGKEGIELAMLDGSVFTGKIAPLDPLTLGTISSCRLVGRFDNANYSLPLTRLSALIFQHHPDEKDQPYTLYHDTGVDEKTEVTPVPAEGKRMEIKDAAGQGIVLSKVTWLSSGTTYTGWYWMGSGRNAPSWFSNSPKTLSFRVGEASIEMDLNRISRRKDIQKTNIPKGVVYCHLVLSDGREFEATLIEPKIDVEFLSYRLVGMTPLGLVTANVKDLKAIAMVAKESPAPSPQKGELTLITDTSGVEWKVYSVKFEGRVHIGNVYYSIDPKRVKRVEIQQRSGEKYLRVLLTNVYGKEVQGILLTEAEPRFNSVIDLGKWTLPLSKVRSITAIPSEPLPPWPPKGIEAMVTDIDNVEWRVYDVKFRDYEKSLPLLIGDAKIQAEFTKLAGIKEIRWKKEEKYPEVVIISSDNQIVEGVLEAEQKQELSGQTEWGTSYIVPVKREIQNILSFVKTASYKTVLIWGTLLL